MNKIKNYFYKLECTIFRIKKKQVNAKYTMGWCYKVLHHKKSTPKKYTINILFCGVFFMVYGKI